MLRIGDVMPDFELPNQDDEVIRLSDYRGQKVILFAFPTADKPTCTKHACAYRDTYAQFAEKNTIILGITSSPTAVLKKWRSYHNFPYNMLSDNRGALLETLGAWGHYIVAGISVNYARRSYWIIDEAGIIQEAQLDVDAEHSVQESLSFIQG